MTPLIAFEGVVKHYGADHPLRVPRLDVAMTDRLAIAGLDLQAAEMVMHMVSAAAVPEAGQVRVAGSDTRAITTDTDWLLSLDRFGIVTRRAVLLGSLSTAANLALPVTVAIEPMSDEIRSRVEGLADEVGLTRATLDAPCGGLGPDDRLRLHLARALAIGPQFLLLEHPTAELVDDEARVAFGKTLRTVADRRGVGWLALTDDARFSRASGSARRHLDPASGRLRRAWLWPWSR